MQGSSTRLILGFGLASLVAGCTRDQPPGSTQPPASRAPSAAPQAPGAAGHTGEMAPMPPPREDSLSGTVIETMDSGGYTYAKLDRGGSQVWTAGPATKLTVGTKLGAMNGTVMTGFRSETLKRTFDQIYFVSEFPVEGRTAGASADPHAAGASADPHAAGATDPHAPPPAATNEPIEKVAPATGGKTIAAVFEGKDALVGKPVVVRGKIVKLNTGILGRNWIHLRDGTGTATTNDLLVTTTATAAVGDIVVARGTLATNKDFGSGYRYDVIVEDATLAAK